MVSYFFLFLIVKESKRNVFWNKVDGTRSVSGADPRSDWVESGVFPALTGNKHVLKAIGTWRVDTVHARRSIYRRAVEHAHGQEKRKKTFEDEETFAGLPWTSERADSH